MARDLSAAIEEIKAKANIVDVISPLVSLKRTGSNYKGCCPFHNEKTPSFIVSESKQIFTCFGCHESGNVISFVQKYYNLTFPEAVEQLAKQYGVTIENSFAENSKKKEGYYEINRQAARYFFKKFTTEANPGYAYMKKRQILPETIKKFGIGYADDNWSSLTEYLISQGADKEMLKELSLSSVGKDGKLYDYFRGRVIFPIINTRDKVIGFGGRIIGSGEPKYLNSKESFVFYKKMNLFGLNLTKNEIQKEGFAIIVEGYMDVVGLYQGGIRNVAASLGTALTEEQAKLLKRFCSKVVLCYDSDQAGINAALRGIDVLRGAGLEVKVLNVDDGKDPDEYIRKHGREDFLTLLSSKSKTDVDYKISLLCQKYDREDTVQAVHFLNSAADILKKLDPIEQDLYVRKVAKDYGFSEGALRRAVEGEDVKTVLPLKKETEADPEEDRNISPKQIQMEKTLIRLVLMHPDYYGKLRDYPESFISEKASAVASVMDTMYEKYQDIDIDKLKDSLDEKHYLYLDDILKNTLIGENDKTVLEDCISKMDSSRRQKRIKEITDILQLSDGTENINSINALMEELRDLQNKERK